MYRLIGGLKEGLLQIRLIGECKRTPLLPSQLLRASHRGLAHPTETRVVGLGFALLSRQAT